MCTKRFNISNQIFLSFLQTFAHELGHALNMPHDFNNRPGNCRKDSSGNACCNKGTVMDYNQVSSHWFLPFFIVY